MSTSKKRAANVILIYLTFSLYNYISCGYHPPANIVVSNKPEIRVGIMENRSRVDFAVIDKFRAMDNSGRVIGSGDARTAWRVFVRDGKPKEMVYLLVVETTPYKNIADELVSNLRGKGVRVEVDILGKALEFRGKTYSDFRQYRVRLPGVFQSRDAARVQQSRLGNQVWTKIEAEQSDKPNGIIVLQNLQTGVTYVSRSLMLITGSRVALKGVTSGEGYHYESSENRIYRGVMEFLVDNFGQLTVINRVTLDDYLKGVVPYEMNANFPLEALKAQAVAARTQVLYSMGNRHADDPFDICDDTHCQVYGGIQNETENSNLAVTETSGLVLTYNDNLCNTVYSSSCGGHTENSENTWEGNPIPYLRGVLDIHRGRNYTNQIDLSDENNLRRWLTTNPKVFCNTVTTEVPSTLNYSKKNFRWELSRSAEQIGQTVRSVTGQNPGRVLDIIPLKRGVSGRLIEIEVRGTAQNVRVSKELQIRRALANPPLLSACIVIDKRRTSQGNYEFTFIGAGSGHGVGMCQTGAAMMAVQGRSFEEILTHYYTDVTITQLY